MRCNDFDTHIDEMLAGILYPDASQHMRQCERCTSHFRARAAVQNSLFRLASATLPGPSRATDRAVMDGYRRLQQRRAVAGNSALAVPAQGAAPYARLLTFPRRGAASGRGSRAWFTSAAAAALVFAVLGSAVHLWKGVPTVNAPAVATAPAVHAPAAFDPEQRASADAPRRSVVAANRASQRPAQFLSRPNDSQSNDSQLNDAQSNASESEAALLRPASSGSPVPTAEEANPSSMPLPGNAAPIIHLASSGAASSMAQAASSTWPGYSNLMYCDPVVCSGPMQVVHIKVPVGQVKPNLGQTVGNDFVNAEVVVGPDGVARAIRVAN